MNSQQAVNNNYYRLVRYPLQQERRTCSPRWHCQMSRHFPGSTPEGCWKSASRTLILLQSSTSRCSGVRRCSPIFWVAQLLVALKPAAWLQPTAEEANSRQRAEEVEEHWRWWLFLCWSLWLEWLAAILLVKCWWWWGAWVGWRWRASAQLVALLKRRLQLIRSLTAGAPETKITSAWNMPLLHFEVQGAMLHGLTV